MQNQNQTKTKPIKTPLPKTAIIKPKKKITPTKNNNKKPQKLKQANNFLNGNRVPNKHSNLTTLFFQLLGNH